MKTRDQLITDALRKCGALGDGETAASAQISAGASAINPLIKAWAAHGLQIWKIERVTEPMSSFVDDSALTVGVGQTIVTTNHPLKLVNAWREHTVDETVTELHIATRQRYLGNPTPTTTGTPVEVYYQPLKTTGQISLWPVPDTDWSTNGNLLLDFQVQFTETSTGSDVIDMPDHWEEALIYALAVRLAPEYGVPINERNLLKIDAKEALDLALSFSGEEGSLFIYPERRY